jgi:hypothetical protein
MSTPQTLPYTFLTATCTQTTPKFSKEKGMLRRDSSRDKPLALLLQGKRRCPAGEILHGLLTVWHKSCSFPAEYLYGAKSQTYIGARKQPEKLRKKEIL